MFYAANRRMYNQWQSNIPSRFVDELPADHIETRNASGLYGNQPRRPGWAGVAEEESQWAIPARMRGGFSGRAFDARQVAPGRYSAEAPPSQTASIKPGDRVFHQKFGYGRVVAVDFNKLEIAFDKAGVKKVMDNFVQPA